MRRSNHLIGLLNFLTFLLSIPILGGGIWLSSCANNTDCMSFLQWPIIIIGVAIMVVSLAGFAGACYRKKFLMLLYLWVMFFIIAALIGFVDFGDIFSELAVMKRQVEGDRRLFRKEVEGSYLGSYSRSTVDHRIGCLAGQSSGEDLRLTNRSVLNKRRRVLLF